VSWHDGQEVPPLTLRGRIAVIIAAVLLLVAAGTEEASAATLEYGAATRTTNLTVSSTSAASPDDVIEVGPITVDGGPIVVEFFTMLMEPSGGAVRLSLWRDSTDLGFYWQQSSATAVAASWRLTPAAGTYTFKVRAYRSSATSALLYGGPGGGGSLAPMQMRVVRANPTLGAGAHDHDDRYYTKPEVDELVEGVALQGCGGLGNPCVVSGSMGLMAGDAERLDLIWVGIWLTAGMLVGLWFAVKGWASLRQWFHA